MEVRLGRRVRLGPARREHTQVPPLPQEIRSVARGAGDTVAVQDLDARVLRRWGLRLELFPQRRSVRELRSVDSRVQKRADGLLDRRRRRLELVSPVDVQGGRSADVLLEDVAGRERHREERIPKHGPVAEAGFRADLDVVGDRRDDPRQLQRIEVLSDLLLDGADELLLAGDPVEVGVVMPETDELKRAPAAEPLVTRLEVDVRKGGRQGADVLVVVTAVNIQPDTAELVDDLFEAVVVDGNQVVDRQTGQLLYRVERAARTAIRECVIDPCLCDRLCAPWAVDGNVQVTGDREQRDRLRHRISAEQHDRVRAAARRALNPGPLIVPEQERDRGVARQHDVEPSLSLLHCRRVRPHSGH